MDANRIALKPFLIMVAALCLAEAVLRAAVCHLPAHPLPLIGLGRLWELSLLWLIAARWGGGLASLGLAGATLAAGLKKGLLWSAACGAVTLLGFVLLFAAGYNPLFWIRAALPADPGELAVFFLVGGAVAPLAEEVFFRGVLYGFLRRWGVAAALFGSTLLFVAAHPPGLALPWPQAVGGILFAAAYEATGSLATPITIHILGNLAIFGCSLLARWLF